MKRSAQIKRKTKETEITVELKLDGTGKYEIATTVPFMDHMLELLARHGLFNLKISAVGDTEVDYHHTVEDLGICLGEAFKKAVSDKKGITRYGFSSVPMDESLAQVNVDFGGRAFLVYNAKIPRGKVGDFEVELIEVFFSAFSLHSGTNLHINLAYGSNYHHIIEAIFKAFAQAMDQATSLDERIKGLMSTKGTLT
ncbi:MAG: imidazoleglycerol-phosphate dehydratase HisB [Deltaproteobacteria bacterium]|nr:MAG: imidazoleglycerol-phosphate dehydratase HisB [Deltaproteobacteria bacterium]